MSGERFDVGEVAVYNRPESKFHGMDVVVNGPLACRNIVRLSGVVDLCWSYEIDADFGRKPPNGNGWAVEPHMLRKRRPPQDWVKLCRLTDRPVEEPA